MNTCCIDSVTVRSLRMSKPNKTGMNGRFVQLLLAVIVVLLSPTAEARRVLVLVTPVWSHIKPKLNVATQLAQSYGHHTTFIMNNRFADKIRKDNFTSVIVPPKFGNYTFKLDIDNVCEQNFSPNRISAMRNEINNVCDMLLSDKELYEHLQKQDFDVVLVDNVILEDCFNMLAYKLGIPYIQIGGLYNSVRTRVPFMPSVHPTIHILGFTEEMTFMQRVTNTLLSAAMATFPNVLFSPDYVARNVPEKPLVTLDTLHRKSAFHLIEADFLLESPRPLMPNVAFVGGAGVDKPKPLPEYLQIFMDSSPEGVIVGAFGSTGAGDTLPEERMKVLLSVFKMFKRIKFVFKYGNETTTDQNILLMSWFPQNDLLAHPNTKAFITHCGVSSMYEALSNGVPMLGLPFMADGFHNCRHMARRGYGVTYDLCTLTESKLFSAIKDLLSDANYADNIRKASTIFHDQPGTPSERAAYWIDHVIKYGGEYLQTIATDMPFYKYYLLDVLLFITFVILFSIYFCVKVTKACCYCVGCCRRKDKID